MCNDILTVLEDIFTEGDTYLVYCGISSLELHGKSLFVVYKCPLLFISENAAIAEISMPLSLFELQLGR
jgi:hypothetical protein